MKKVKTIEIKNLQTPEIQELNDSDLSGIVGGSALADKIKNLESHLVGLESQLEKLNPQTEVGKALLTSLETLVKTP
ncbi:MAG: hypothetical protein ACYTXI_35265 [Nostoc sp.]